MVLCLSPTGLSVARALAGAGVPVYGSDPDRFEIGHFSSLFLRHPEFSCERSPDRLLQALVRFARSAPRPPVLFTAGDEQVEWVAEHHTELAAHFKLQDCARPEIAGRFVDKRAFYSWVSEAGAELPATHYPLRQEDVDALAAHLRYPVILKPARGHAWRRHLRGAKVVEAASAAELRRSYAEQSRYDPAVIVQEVVPGAEREIVVAACAVSCEGKPLAVFTARKVRQYPYYFGSACCCVSEWVPQVAEQSMDLLSRLDFRGVCGTEYKRDPRSGRWVLIEINPRPTLWYDLARAAGINPLEAVYRDLVGLEPLHPARQRDGVLWRYLARDWAACARSWTRRDPDAPAITETLRWPDSEAILYRGDRSAWAAYPLYVVVHAARHLAGG